MQSISQYVVLSMCMRFTDDLHSDFLYKQKGAAKYANTFVKDYEHDRYVSLCQGLEEGLSAWNNTDLEGITIPVAVTNYPPFLWILHNEKNTDKNVAGTVLGKGTSWELMMTLAAFFNFRPEPKVAMGDVVGRRDKDGKWMGALELLEKEEAEFTVLPVTITHAREEIADFSVLLGTTTFGILVKRPQYVPKPDALLRPFTFDVWLWILGMMGVMGPLIYLIILLRVRLCKGDPTLTRIFPLDQCVWFVFGAMMKQGSVLKPISDSSRILFATWWLFITIVTSFYTANLTAYLTFNGLSLPIEKVDDLAKDPDIKWVAFRDGALMDIIMEHPKLQVLRDMREEGRGAFLGSHEEALELVKAGTHVYIDDMRVLEYLIQADFKKQRSNEAKEKCHFYATPLVQDNDFIFWYGYAFRKGSEYKDLFDGFFRRLSYFGILNFLHDNATSSTPVCTQSSGASDRSLRNNDLFTTYALGLIGTLAAIVAFVCEFMCRRRKRNSATTVKKFSSNLKAKFPNIPTITTTPPHDPHRTKSGGRWADDPNLPPFPTQRPRTPFEVRYRDFVDAPSRSGGGMYARQVEGGFLVGANTPDVVHGKINGQDVQWDRKTNELIMKDPSNLTKGMAVIGGIPYTFLQYVDHEGPKVQKMVLSDLI